MIADRSEAASREFGIAANTGKARIDRVDKAVARLWGSLGEGGRLHASPIFASELAARSEADLAVCAPSVSKWSYGKQLEHLYLSTHYVVDRLEEAMAGKNASGRMGIYGYGLLVGGFIPRYVFPTIPPLQPESGTLEHIVPLKESLDRRLGQIAWDLAEMKASLGKSRHPRMKYLTAGQWLFFADIHHRHHLALMRDILKAAG